MGVVVVALAGGGVGAWAALSGKKHHNTPVADHTLHPTTTVPSTSAQPTTSVPTTSAPPPSPSPTSSLVSVAPTVTPQANEQAVLTFLTNYFTAINNHSFSQYRSLLDAQERAALTLGQFDTGYQGTRDSAATLTSLAPQGPGSTAVAVSFTSHQPAADSPSRTTCTSWNITLYLRSQGGSYVIGAAPAGYHASYSAC